MSQKRASENTAPNAGYSPGSAPAPTTSAANPTATTAPLAAPQPIAPAGANGAAPRSAPKVAVPRKVVCPVSGTVFNPRTTGGKCPVCGEQVVPAELVASASVGGKLAETPVGAWVAKDGNWKLVALIVLVLYQVGLFAWVWAELASKHAF